MSERRHVLLVNPFITSRRHARFPLSIMTMAAALEGSHESTLIDGNMDRDAVRSVCDALGSRPYDAVGITVMGGPQVATARVSAVHGKRIQGLSVASTWMRRVTFMSKP